MGNGYILKGQVLAFSASPFAGERPQDAARILDAVAVQDGRIAGAGTLAEMQVLLPEAETVDHSGKLIMAGFVDAHVHYPQTAIIASWGKRLIDWLNSYTFPEEMRFGDRGYADEIASRYLDLTAAHGTTTVCSYCTIHPESVDAFFSAAKVRGQRVAAGKTCMDRNAPEGLRDTAQSAYDDSEALIARWHGVDRLEYAITPRFSPTSTPEQLEAMGALWAKHPECLMQTHLSEQTDEIEWVKSLFPQARDYLDTYEEFGLLGAKGLYGHAIHLEERERHRLRDYGAALIHCPTSNTFIGSGLFDMAGLMAEGHRIGLATDTGGGSSFSIF
ncbi:guanine deaminase, partial [Leisingera sp. JC1]|uniref:guanine deaminase n=1 Tax=Leisingera sp. JC1 TaxID=1855282 RepID=UPI000802D1C9